MKPNESDFFSKLFNDKCVTRLNDREHMNNALAVEGKCF